MARKKMSAKKKLAAATAILLVAALLMGGAFAWVDFSQSFINRFRGGASPDVLLHDDFEPWVNKDVYVENTGEQPLIIRVLFREYFQVGNEILVGADINDPATWPIHIYDEHIPLNACDEIGHSSFQWELSGAQKTYLHGTSEQGNENWEGQAVEDPANIGPNAQMFGLTQAAHPPIHIDEWKAMTYRDQRELACWVLDTDGWAYWSQVLLPGEATNLLLDNVTMIKAPDDNFFYQIDVQLQAANRTEWHLLNTGKNGLPVITPEAQEEIVDPILDLDEDVDVLVNRMTPIDVQLAVGITDIDYTYLERDLRSVLATMSPALAADQISITTAKEVSSTDSTSEFSWWVYDHTRPAAAPYNGVAEINHTTHTYIENDTGTKQTGSYGTGVTPAPGPVNADDPTSYGYTPDPTNPDIGAKAHPYVGNSRHMIESNNGATLDFYGYGQYSYKDFMFYPDKIKGIKTFEFAIEEDLAFDAMDGAGFFFNTEITGTYGAGQTMSGYLMFLTYTGGNTGQAMTLYKFKNIDTKAFHNVTATTVASYAGFTKVATSAVYSGAHKSRKIKAVIAPDAITAYYVGSTTLFDSSVTDVKIPDGVAPVEWTMTDNGTGQANGSLQTTIALDSSYVSSYGFGPMCSYVSHSCARPTHMTFKNLTMSMERPRSLVEVLRDADWIADATKFIINLDEDIIPDFENTGITGEILDHLYTDDIYYLGWDSSINHSQSKDFLALYENNGVLVNTSAAATATYAQQLQALADAIYARYWLTNVGDVCLADGHSILEAINAATLNTADSHWPGGKWSFIHRSDGFHNPGGTHPLSGQDLAGLDFPLDRPGYYDIYYKDKFVKTLTAHRAPVASFTVSLNGSAAPTLTSTSYDPDVSSGGIVSEAWSYMDLDGAAKFISGKPGAILAGHTYVIKLEVTDQLGAIAVTSERIG